MPTEHTDLNLSDKRVILTCAVLDPHTIPADGVYLEVIATLRRFELDGELACHITTTATTDKFTSLPFDDRSQFARDRLSGTAEEGGDKETSESRVNDINTSSFLTALDDVTGEDQAAIFTPMTHIDEDDDDGFWEMIRRATGYYLYDHPEKFAEAQEVYMVRVPYWIEDRWTIRFYVKKEVNDALTTCITSPPLAYYWTGIVERQSEEASVSRWFCITAISLYEFCPPPLGEDAGEESRATEEDEATDVQDEEEIELTSSIFDGPPAERPLSASHGGPTGVEFAAELHDLLHTEVQRHFSGDEPVRADKYQREDIRLLTTHHVERVEPGKMYVKEQDEGTPRSVAVAF
ncbi:uncharacterized protein B0H18DRAFT_1121974 [Fomitopsis serialis]|uniref:uncharacterized protein n=1 Tax=Fomitopsis serialis TaxID=139415 RepID=UPI002007AACC|nr:uncharacterized protein B0H18DRAFT_1121974 [Neoantrodia serialis]KAH9920381.1 hypothetical protein B0H18DRAFT_1121974 [Neoantrodia serialis]